MTTAEHSIVQRSIRLRMPLLSLRTIVIVAALAVIVTVLTIGTWVWIGITNDRKERLDRRLDEAAGFDHTGKLLVIIRQICFLNDLLQCAAGLQNNHVGLNKTLRCG